MDLPQSLKQDTEYSLLGLFGAEGSIDFTTGRELSDVEIENDGFILEEQGIELIRIVDENTLEIVYILEVIEVEFEYKLLTELKIESISRKNATNSRVNIELRDEIELESDFIFIVVSLLDSDGNEVAFENSIYDFTSPAQLEVSI